MSSRILANKITDLNTFIHDPFNILKNVQDGILAILDKNALAFYVVVSKRLEELIEIEKRALGKKVDIILENQFFQDPFFQESKDASPLNHIGKFTMYQEWNPGIDFQNIAALWGMSLSQPVTQGELAAFISFWQAEGRAFHHIQWQQKLARSIQISRSKISQLKKNTNLSSELDRQIPEGFRGYK